MSEGPEAAAWFREKLTSVRDQVSRAIVGQTEVVEGVLVCLAANGHVLLEGMPGLGKTLLVRSLAQTTHLQFSRIQFTPDMMPADVTGTHVLSQSPEGARSFEFRRGPIFANLVLADEINRATPKTQSALLEAMQERSVTSGGTGHQLPEPFLVMATQNPVEQEGTYPLPEAQLDRFFYKVLVPYPSKADLEAIVNLTTGNTVDVPEQVAEGADIIEMRRIVREVPVSQTVLDFALSVIVGTHAEGEGSTEAARKYCRYGSSPRGAQTLVTAGKVYALMDGRYNVSVEDIEQAALPALRHRILLNFEAEADGIAPDRILRDVVAEVKTQKKDPIGV